MIDCGALGGLLLALSALPQVWAVIRQGHAHGLSWGLLLLWLFGEGIMLFYSLSTYPDDWRLMLNYGANFALVGVLVWYRVWPRK